MKRVLFLFFLLLSLSFSYELKGCGGTFAGEVMKDLSDSFYETSKNKVEYLAIGSSGGLKKVMNNDCDFAILELETTGEELERVPFLKGAVVLAYNLDNVSSLILSREIIAKIYMGKITKWNDEEILALNKDLSLPDKKINLFHRYDGSGTTLNFSKYLSESKAWKNGVSEY
ncbi:MAG: hypothetical protein GX282_05200, partial [Campylobacteraceae bacterium]|nr:hypothetical protein [Campylobacteraceae bacterium]